MILGAVAIATLLITWATGSHAISKLFDSVISKVLPCERASLVPPRLARGNPAPPRS